MWGETVGVDSGERFASLAMMVSCFVRQHSYDEAEALALELLERSEGKETTQRDRIHSLLLHMRTVYRSTGRLDEAKAVDARMAEVLKPTGGSTPGPPAGR